MKVYACPACGSAPMIKKKMNKYGEFYTTIGCQRCDRFLITEEQKDSLEIYKEWDESITHHLPVKRLEVGACKKPN